MFLQCKSLMESIPSFEHLEGINPKHMNLTAHVRVLPLINSVHNLAVVLDNPHPKSLSSGPG